MKRLAVLIGVTCLLVCAESRRGVAFGNSETDTIRDQRTDAAGNTYLTGWTTSPTFPATAGAAQPKMAIDPTLDANFYRIDSFVVKLNRDGQVVYATFLGGTRRDFAEALAIAPDGSVFVTGRTGSYDFPVTASAFQTKLYTYGLTDDGAFVAKISADGAKIEWATYFCGTNGTYPRTIAVGADNAPVVGGVTYSADHPVLNAVQATAGGNTNYPFYSGDGFAAKFTPDGSALIFSTYLGGVAGDVVRAATVDAGGNIYLAGATQSIAFPKDREQALTGSALYRMDDVLQPVAIQTIAVFTVVAAPSNSAILYAGTPEGMLRSDDGGATWFATALTQIGVGVIAVHPENPDIVWAGSCAPNGLTRVSLGNHGGLWRSTDGGLTFLRRPVGPEGIWPENYLANDSYFIALTLDPQSPSTLYAVLGNGPLSFGAGADQYIYKSEDYGDSWTAIRTGLRSTLGGLTVDPSDSNVVYLSLPSYFCCGRTARFYPGQIHRSVDGGRTFSLLVEDNKLASVVIDRGRIFSGSLVSKDNGATWSELPTAGRIVAVQGNTLYSITVDGNVEVSTDNGVNWSAVAGAYTSLSVATGKAYLGAVVNSDAFLTKLTPIGELVFTRLFGTLAADEATAVAVAANGNLSVTWNGGVIEFTPSGELASSPLP